MMPLKGVARTLPPGAAAAAGDASASVELLASGEEGFFPAASVGNGEQMTTVAKTRLLLRNYSVSCVDEVVHLMLMRRVGAPYERCGKAKMQGVRFEKLTDHRELLSIPQVDYSFELET